MILIFILMIVLIILLCLTIKNSVEEINILKNEVYEANKEALYYEMQLERIENKCKEAKRTNACLYYTNINRIYEIATEHKKRIDDLDTTSTLQN